MYNDIRGRDRMEVGLTTNCTTETITT